MMKKTKWIVILAAVSAVLICACGKKDAAAGAQSGQEESKEAGKKDKKPADGKGKEEGKTAGKAAFSTAEEAFHFLYGEDEEPYSITVGTNRRHHKIPKFEILIPKSSPARDIGSRVKQDDTYDYGGEYGQTVTDIEQTIEESEYIPMDIMTKGGSNRSLTLIGITTDNSIYGYQEPEEAKEYLQERCKEDGVELQVVDDCTFMYAGDRTATMYCYPGDSCRLCYNVQDFGGASGEEILAAMKMLITPVKLTDEEINALPYYEQELSYPAWNYMQKCEVESVSDFDRETWEKIFDGKLEGCEVSAWMDKGEPNLREEEKSIYTDQDRNILVTKREYAVQNSWHIEIDRYDLYQDEEGKDRYYRTYYEIIREGTDDENKIKKDVMEQVGLMGVQLKDADW